MNEILIEQCSYLIDDTLPNIANISNLIALLYHEMENTLPIVGRRLLRNLRVAGPI